MMDQKKQVEEALQRIRESKEGISETGVFDTMNPIGRRLHEAGHKIDLVLEAEIIGFGLHPVRMDQERPWGTYFGPGMTWKGEDGVQNDSPALESITEEVLHQWSIRAETETHPCLRARYADLLWDLTKKVSGKKPSPEHARIAVISYLQAVEESSFKFQLQAKENLRRARCISRQLGDMALQYRVEQAIEAFESKSAQDDLPGTWGDAMEIALEKTSMFSADDKERIKNGIYERLGRLFQFAKDNPQGLNPNAMIYGVTIMTKWYRSIKDDASLNELFDRFTEAMLSFCEARKGLFANHWLMVLQQILLDNGQGELAKRIRLKIHENQATILDEMEKRSVTFEIPGDEIRKMLATFEGVTFDTALRRLAIMFYPDVEEFEKRVQNGFYDGYIAPHIAQDVHLDQSGRMTAVVGTIDQDPEGRTLDSIAKSLMYTASLAEMCLERINELHDFNHIAVLDYLYQSPLFSEERRQVFERGLFHYFTGDYISAISVLVPQIEGLFRNLLSHVGGQIMVPNRLGGFDYKGLDSLLSEAKEHGYCEKRLCTYLRVVFTDARGWNLRNEICHALNGSQCYNKVCATRILLVLLLLSIRYRDT